MMPEHLDGDGVTQFRLGQLEANIKELRGDLKEAIGVLGGGMTALQTQLSSYQTSMIERFVLRRDFDNIVKSVDELQAREGARGWMIAGALLSALGSLIVGVIGWLRPLH